MKIHIKLIAIATILFVATESKPSWSDFHISHYYLPSEWQKIIHHEDPYHLSTLNHFPLYSIYNYWSPLYDLHNPWVWADVWKKYKPNKKDKTIPPSTTTVKPRKEMVNDVEKFDLEVKPEKQTKKMNLVRENAATDSITTESA